MGYCGNQHGTKCNFSCPIGYRLNGSSVITCVAPGNQHPGVWNDSVPTCEGEFELPTNVYTLNILQFIHLLMMIENVTLYFLQTRNSTQ